MLTQSYLRILMGVSDPLARQFYLEMAHIERWSTRILEDKIDGQLYKKTAISRRPEEVIKQELQKVRETHAVVSNMVFRSTYFLDILGLPDVFSEEALENAVLNQVEEFMHEMGSDFTLVERQKRG